MKWMECLPPVLRAELIEMNAARLTDLRLFAGRTARADTQDGPVLLQTVLDAQQLYDAAQALCGHMLRLSPETTGQGFITLQGGHRMGLCGRVTQKNGALVLQELGSICLRIAHEVKGCGQEIANRFLSERGGILLAGAPGSGKTTLLRDAVRLISEHGAAVGLSDERGEVAACLRGVAQLDVGPNTHVLDGCPKADALRWLLRALRPDVLAMDEIYGMEECLSVREAAAGGVPVIATLHAGSIMEAAQRESIHMLLAEGIIRHIALLRDGKVIEMQRGASCCAR